MLSLAEYCSLIPQLLPSPPGPMDDSGIQDLEVGEEVWGGSHYPHENPSVVAAGSPVSPTTRTAGVAAVGGGKHHAAPDHTCCSGRGEGGPVDGGGGAGQLCRRRSSVRMAEGTPSWLQVADKKLEESGVEIYCYEDPWTWSPNVDLNEGRLNPGGGGTEGGRRSSSSLTHSSNLDKVLSPLMNKEMPDDLIMPPAPVKRKKSHQPTTDDANGLLPQSPDEVFLEYPNGDTVAMATRLVALSSSTGNRTRGGAATRATPGAAREPRTRKRPYSGSKDFGSCGGDAEATVPGKSRKYIELEHAGFAPYETDIYLHRRSIESDYHPVECLANQSEITTGMRALLVEWLTKVHSHFQLNADSLFLAVNIIDRFLVTTPISRDCFQLLAITSLLISCKHEEVFPPQVDELLRMCSEAYSREQILQLERLILGRLQFDLLAPTSIIFLEYHSAWRMCNVKHIACTSNQIRRTRAVGRYVLELTLQDYNLCQFPPTLLALGALELADHILDQRTRLGALCTAGYGQSSLQECICELRMLTDSLMKNCLDLDDIFEKYLNPHKLDYD